MNPRYSWGWQTRGTAVREMIRNHPAGPARSVPDRNATDTLLLATWNLKEFAGGESDKRNDESYWYIAEIVSHFDLIAIQEVGVDLLLTKSNYKLLANASMAIIRNENLENK